MNTEIKIPFEPDYAVAPGETLREVMESLGMTQKDLATRTSLTEQSINRIFKGEQPITHETANRLELVTGVPARFWNNLEALYREQLTKLEERQRLERDFAWLKSIPTKELIARGAIEEQADKVSLLRETLRFYSVCSVDAWQEVWKKPAIAARRSTCFESQPGPTSAWICLGERAARSIECNPYERTVFLQALRDIRVLTRGTPEVFVPEMISQCAKAGVALALVPEMKKVPWNGATKWLTPYNAMILLNLRGKVEDRFWFSFFHEAGHVLNDNKRNFYISDESDEPEEQAANRFAAEFLIPRKYDDIIRGFRSAEDFIAFAKELNIATGIIVGRYQHLTQKWDCFKNLIRTFRWNTSPSL